MNELKNGIERHVVLVEPEVHWNTGNIGRTCLGADAALHLIRPLGFSLDSRQVKRAGLDYWHEVRLNIWENFDEFLRGMKPENNEMVLFAKLGKKPVWELPELKRLFLVFGSETRGLPANVLDQFSSAVYHIPITDRIRCLNLSTAVGIALYESLRGTGSWHSW